MPPAISDNEASESENEIAPRRPVANDPVDEDEDEDDEDDDDGPDDPEEYVVEKIVKHLYDEDAQEIKYQVKWLGYEDKGDMTWEPEENLTSAQDALADYFKSIGGRPAAVSGKKAKASRKRSSTAVNSPSTKGRAGKKGKLSEDATPELPPKNTMDTLPKGLWETHINFVETIEEVPSKSGELRRVAYVLWNDGKRTQHPLNVVNQKCPQKMLIYYEQHLVFKQNDSDLKDDSEANGA